jgi:hypothetical protein
VILFLCGDVMTGRGIDGGVDVVHGHSSHHPRPIEVYRNRLILYGCGDFINDYEGILGHEEYLPELTLMYFPTFDAASGELRELRMTPWLGDKLARISVEFRSRVEASDDGSSSCGGTDEPVRGAPRLPPDGREPSDRAPFPDPRTPGRIDTPLHR